MSEIQLRYGCNPHQAPARVFMSNVDLPIEVLSGAPGYINLCDALNAWQLVKELKASLGLPAAASFKHVSPAGAALGLPMADDLKRACFVEDMELTPLAAAYARARGADRMSSFGDWAALSDVCDEATARILKREVSDGVIAPGYTAEALEILRAKRDGKYHVVRIDPAYSAPELERREIFGITFEQKRNTLVPGFDLLGRVVTARRELPAAAQRDLLLALITLKYTQSNSVCFAFDGQVIGVGAGQQSRVHCTRLAAAKADKWFLRQHPAVLGLSFRAGVNRADRNNAIDQYLEDWLSPAEARLWAEQFDVLPEPLDQAAKRAYLATRSGVALGSDAFFPFRDNIDRAQASGVSYVAQPGGSVRDDAVIQACDEYGMAMCFTGVRLFHH
jgi:phosphoribosylaminoimidazolecarboxamide formyltransferase/IMP cyclohydrolase/phosphoribosylaminoimidazolecarboxamide formyltransferase